MRTRPPIILQDPHPALRTVCATVTHFDSSLAFLVGQMKLAIDAFDGTLAGLAANQIGETKRVIVVVQGGQKIAMVNPVLKVAEGVQTVTDGCASVQHGKYFRARTRPAFVQVVYQDELGHWEARRAKGLHAAAIAHEIDHLDGKLFTDESGEDELP